MRRPFCRLRNLPNPLKVLLDKIRQMPDPSPRGDRAMMLLGHYSTIAVVVFGAFSVADDIAGRPGGWAQDVYNVLVLSFLAFWWSEIRWHAHRLCARCARQAPLDPQERVRRWRPALRWMHMERARNLSLAVMFAVITAESAWGMDGYRNYVDIGVIVFIAAMWVVGKQHSVLQPWCPWCNWGKGGDEEVSPEVPDPALSK